MSRGRRRGSPGISNVDSTPSRRGGNISDTFKNEEKQAYTVHTKLPRLPWSSVFMSIGVYVGHTERKHRGEHVLESSPWRLPWVARFSVKCVLNHIYFYVQKHIIKKHINCRLCSGVGHRVPKGRVTPPPCLLPVHLSGRRHMGGHGNGLLLWTDAGLVHEPWLRPRCPRGPSHTQSPLVASPQAERTQVPHPFY